LKDLPHTPTPWDINETHTVIPWFINETLSSGVAGYEVTGPNGEEIFDDNEFSCEAPSLGNAAFIVRACNAHDELVAALKAVRAWGIAEGDGSGSQDHQRKEVWKKISTALSDHQAANDNQEKSSAA
jgi:hypothetical protein